MARRLKKPYLLESVEITDMLTNGKSVTRTEEGQVVFVDGGVPGDIVDVFVSARKKKTHLGRVQKLVKASPDRIEPECQHFKWCGGCKLQSLGYDKQAEIKARHVESALKRIGHLEIQEHKPILGAEKPLWYRNKTEFSFGDKRWLSPEEIESGEDFTDEGSLGFHISGVFYKVLEIDECLLHKPIINEVRNELRSFCRAQGYSFYNFHSHEGLMRNVMFRTSDGTGELMINLIVGEDDPEAIDAIFGHLKGKFPQITSFIWIVNKKLNNYSQDLPWRHWGGADHITEHLGEYKFRISPTSFFQTNTSQAEHLYDVVKNLMEENMPESGAYQNVYDLYCGAGSIGIYVSELAKKITGIEYVEDAVKDAHVNLDLNGLDHLEFFAGDMKELLSGEFIEKQGRPDLVITDPPRAGMDKPVVEQLIILKAPRIIYVSCNPATQARDLELLSEVYEIKSIQPVDMFPQTSHVESVADLVLKSEA